VNEPGELATGVGLGALPIGTKWRCCVSERDEAATLVRVTREQYRRRLV
jgi:hypothetical protein